MCLLGFSGNFQYDLNKEKKNFFAELFSSPRPLRLLPQLKNKKNQSQKEEEKLRPENDLFKLQCM
jgi:hypothetical protein